MSSPHFRENTASRLQTPKTSVPHHSQINCDISFHCVNQMLCGNITAACSENGMKPTKTVSGSTILRFLTLTEAVSTVTTVLYRLNPFLSVTYELHF